jgi:hypothetical protein
LPRRCQKAESIVEEGKSIYIPARKTEKTNLMRGGGGKSVHGAPGKTNHISLFNASRLSLEIFQFRHFFLSLGPALDALIMINWNPSKFFQTPESRARSERQPGRWQSDLFVLMELLCLISSRSDSRLIEVHFPIRSPENGFSRCEFREEN